MVATWNNRFIGNNVSGNIYGIGFDWVICDFPDFPEFNHYCENNTIAGNVIEENSQYGIEARNSTGNLIFHNNFVNNAEHIGGGNWTDLWDDGYPSGGNYWSDYTDVDLCRGSNQDVFGSDGIWDHPYQLDENSQDHYPLVNPWTLPSESYLAVRGAHNEIYYRTYNFTSKSWESWCVIREGATCDSPAVVAYSGKLYFVVRGMDGGSIWFGSVNLTDYSFSGWQSISGATQSAPTLVNYDSKLVLVVRGLDNSIYHRLYDCVSGVWEGWSVVPNGSTIDGPAAAVLEGVLHIVVRGADGYSVWHSSVNMTTSDFSGWELIGGATESKPTLAWSESRLELYLVVRGLDNVVYYNVWNGVDWEGWTSLSSGATCDSPGATVIDDRLHIVVRGMDEYSLWHMSVDLTTSIASDWALIDGATNSAPTLIN